MAENPRVGGWRQGVGGGVELPQGTNNPGVNVLPPEDETPRVDTKGNGVMWEDGQGWGGHRNHPNT